MYAYGLGVEADKTQSMRWIVEAAEAGNLAAQYNAAKMYRDGDGVAQNYTEAVKWYRLAANAGYSKAQAGLAKRYAAGEGVEKNLVQALMWTTLAANQGLGRAITTREDLLTTMSFDDIAAADGLVKDWTAPAD